MASRGDAVESVAAVLGANKEVARFGAHAEEMAWLIVRNDFVGEFDNIGSFGCLGSVEGTDAVTVYWLLGHEFGGFATKIFEETTLNNGVKILFGLAGFLGCFSETLMFGDIAGKPVMGAYHSFSDEFFIIRIDGLIESHMNVGANLPLSLHGNFGIHADFVAVNVGFKGDTVVVDFSVGERKHLKTARVGKSRAVPAGKFGKTAGFFDKIWAGGENEVVCISENALRAKFAHLGVGDGFNGGTGGGTDESWSLDVAVWRMDDAGAHKAFLFDNVEFKHFPYYNIVLTNM